MALATVMGRRARWEARHFVSPDRPPSMPVRSASVPHRCACRIAEHRRRTAIEGRRANDLAFGPMNGRLRGNGLPARLPPATVEPLESQRRDFGDRLLAAPGLLHRRATQVRDSAQAGAGAPGTRARVGFRSSRDYRRQFRGDARRVRRCGEAPGSRPGTDFGPGLVDSSNDGHNLSYRQLYREGICRLTRLKRVRSPRRIMRPAGAKQIGGSHGDGDDWQENARRNRDPASFGRSENRSSRSDFRGPSGQVRM